MNFSFVCLTWGPVLVWAGVIFYLSSIPGLQSGLGAWDTVLRKIAHVVEFGILTGLLYRAFRKTFVGWAIRRVTVVSALSAILYAVSDEIHQRYVPGRGPSVVDVLIDTVGVILMIVVIRRMRCYEK